MKTRAKARGAKGLAAPAAEWRVRPRWRVVNGGAIALGPGKADLLERIARSGSISAAAALLGMSYRRAWMLVAAMNGAFRRPLVATSSRRRAGAALTREGAEVLRLYRRIEDASLAAVRRETRALRRLLRPGR